MNQVNDRLSQISTVWLDLQTAHGDDAARAAEAKQQIMERYAGAIHRYLLGATIDYMQELGYYDRKRIHNLKYYTWVEQQGKSYQEIQAQWYNDSYWTGIPDCAEAIDALIEEFNRRTGLLDK